MSGFIEDYENPIWFQAKENELPVTVSDGPVFEAQRMTCHLYKRGQYLRGRFDKNGSFIRRCHWFQNQSCQFAERHFST